MQKLKDALLLAQKDRRFQLVVFLGIFAVLFLIFGEPKQGPRNAPLRDTPDQTGSPTIARNEAAEEVVRVFSSKLEQTDRSIKELSEKVGETSSNLHELEEQTANIFRKMLEKLADVQVQQAQAPYPQVSVTEEAPAFEDAPAPESAELEFFGEQQAAVVPPTQPEVKPAALIGAGDSVRVRLLAGVNAPTDGTPYPVVFQLMSDVYGPDGSALPLGEARLIAAAQGSLTDQRALFRLTKMNVRLPDGRRKVFPVDGWVVGEDGIRGMSGVLIDPIGKVIAGSALAAGVGAAGQGLAASQLTTNVNGVGGVNQALTGDTAEFAAGQGIAGGARAWESIIRERYSNMVPVVQVLSGRDATAVFSGSFVVEDLYDAVDDDNSQLAQLY